MDVLFVIINLILERWSEIIELCSLRILVNVKGIAARVVALFFFIDSSINIVSVAFSSTTKVAPTNNDACKQPSPKECDKGSGRILISDLL